MRVLASVKKSENSYENSDVFNLTPEYKILENGNIEIINLEERKDLFPNCGQVIYIANYGTENKKNYGGWQQTAKILNKYNGKLAKIDIDMDSSNVKYDEENTGSCKYGLTKYMPVKELNQDDIIEVIKAEDINDIEQLIEANERYIKIETIPLNKRIMLIIGGYIYGPFEYSVVGNIKDEEEIISRQKINITSCSTITPKNSINKYKRENLNSLIEEVNILYTNRFFIYSKKDLDNIKPEESIDFIDNDTLVNLFKKIVKNNEDYNITNNEIKIIKKCIPNCETIDFKDSKLKRLSKISDRLVEDIEFQSIIRSKFIQSEEWKKSVEDYINKNNNIIEDIVKKNINYNKYEKECIEKLEYLNNEIAKRNEELENINVKKDEIAQNEMKSFRMQIDEIKQEHSLKQEEFENLEANIKKLKNEVRKYEDLKAVEEDVSYYNRRKDELKSDINKVKDELIKVQNDTDTALAHYIGDKKIKETFDKVFFNNNQKVNDINYLPPKVKKCNYAQDIQSVFKEKLERTGREFSKEDIVNLLISISQNFITVFAGEPGVGKTSICKIIAKCFGVYPNRFANVSVERGWTSPKDLIGYYNPITQQIEKTNESMYNFLETINEENNIGENNLYIALLDEANLSSIEHYWSNFMQLTDDYRRSSIELGGEIKYALTEGARFLATINYDHTTETLSDRFLDRAWIILMDSNDNIDNLDSIIGNSELEQVNEEDLEALDELISFEDIKKFYGTPNKELREHLQNELIVVLRILKDNKVYISQRSKNAIVNYCSVAQEYMAVDNGSYLPLDYAISQKVLPMLKGHGEKYSTMLKSLKENFESAGLNKCKAIVEKMLTIGEEEYEYYQFFAR